MRVLVWSESQQFGGHERMAVKLVSGVASDFGVKVVWYHHPDNGLLAEALKGSQTHLIPRTWLPDKFMRGFVGSLRPAFQAAAHEVRPDLIVVVAGWPTCGSTPAFSGIRIPILTYVPNGPIRTGFVGNLKCRLSGTVLQASARIVTCSQAIAERFRGLTEIPVGVVENFIDVPTPVTIARRLRPAIGLVGRIDIAVKGHDTLAHALAQVPTLREEFDWHVFGIGPDAGRLSRLLAQHRLTGIVHCHGWVDDVAIYPQLDAVVIPSRTEGSPLVAIEAAIRGLPVIGSSLPALDPYAIPDLRFAIDDSLALARAVQSWSVRRMDEKFVASLVVQQDLVRKRHNRLTAVGAFHQQLLLTVS